MRILLVRHGRPLLKVPRRVRGAEVAALIENYDAAGIDLRHPPPAPLRRTARSAEVVLSSDLRRAVESARVLFPKRRLRKNPLFREADIPRTNPLPWQIDPLLWSLAARTVWFLGWSPDAESFAVARQRARLAARHLHELSARHGSVALVGHGVFNALIGWELRSEGWQGPRLLAGSYWTWGVYRRAGEARPRGGRTASAKRARGPRAAAS
jgi:broad specificity phosphatase PhoE